jgi:hypothetical protein
MVNQYKDAIASAQELFAGEMARMVEKVAGETKVKRSATAIRRDLFTNGRILFKRRRPSTWTYFVSQKMKQLKAGTCLAG